MPGNSDKDIVEFLGDVSSFANSDSGDLVYGIAEDRRTGLPKTIEGLTVGNIDQEILRLENRIRSGIQPRILGVTTHPVKLSTSKWALVIRIPGSWNKPHRVTFKGHDKFYSRSTNGKYQMDVGELRIAFNLSETIGERIRRFREERISKIIADEAPFTFFKAAKIILHLIPVASFNPTQVYDVEKVHSSPAMLPPMDCQGWNRRYNFDGVLTYSADLQDRSYVQLFRNGIIEAVEQSMLRQPSGKAGIPSLKFEEVLIDSVQKYLSVLKSLSVQLPILVFLALVGVKGFTLYVSNSVAFEFGKGYEIDRDILFTPEIIIESHDTDIRRALKPCFDTIWNACGYPRSLYYNESGEWIGRY